MTYNFKEIEKKWQERWDQWGIYKADDNSDKEKRYILDMFPYPSAAGLHTGHVESYTATDIISRYLRMKGYNVMHPQGWDAFGLPAENFAIKTKTHPSETTQAAIANFTKQMKSLGFSYDWSREINSSDPEYYKWTQWFFLLLYKHGWAYKKKASVNWCDSCQTVLANEQAEGGICERCKHTVIQKDMEQWFFKITDFIEDKGNTSGLLSGLDKIDWPESTKAGQRNWIGKSVGAIIKFEVRNEKLEAREKINLEVYTTRLDTIYGCTYAVIAPEHPLNKDCGSIIDNYEEVDKYVEESKKKSELQRMAETKEKSGVEIKGLKLVNPFNNETIPLFVADYVIAHYGTGAVMAVPAHDARDWEFAKKYNIEIRRVIAAATELKSQENNLDGAFVDDGILVNSGLYNGLTSAQAREKMSEWLAGNNSGGRKVNYRMRDWLVSRQRYWGAPIPIVYCAKCGELPVAENDLPVLLPTDVDFMPTGESPLARSKDFQDVKCPVCGEPARRESDTMDTFVCSSWYYYRYADPKNTSEYAAKEKIKKWLPVDLYMGGAEHVVLHLLYSRFFTKVLHQLGYIEFDEPFAKLRHQGMILAEDGRKMSKSLGNVINPDIVVGEFGADAVRMYEMFMGPLEDAKPWNTKGIVGVYRFLEKVFYLNKKADIIFEWKDPEMDKIMHKTIKKVTEDIENLKFNTAVSQMMIAVNAICEKKRISSDNYWSLLTILSPFAPHIAEELWEKLGNKESIFKSSWPAFDPALARDDVVELVLQINGKVRDKIEVKADITEEEAKELAEKSDKIGKWTEGKEIKKVIFVKGRLLNIVVG